MSVDGMTHEETTAIEASPAAIYELLADVGRMGDWSPECVGARWSEGATGAVGDTFEGDNQIGERTWSVECTVTEASPGSEFGWTTGPADDPYVHWLYRIEPTDGGAAVTEVWDVQKLPPTLADRTADELAGRAEMVRAGMKTTLEALKAAAEA